MLPLFLRSALALALVLGLTKAQVPPPLSFDCALTSRMLYYAMATYNTPGTAWDCPYCEGVPGFTLTTACRSGEDISNSEAGYAFVGFNSEQQEAVLAFRGSANIANWIQNIRVLQMSFPGVDGANVSTGFYDYYNNLKTCVVAALKSLPSNVLSWPLHTTGHSLGAAAATIAALDLSTNEGIKVSNLYTFGSPRVGNGAFVSAVMAVVPSAQRMTNGGDCVTKLPISSGPQSYVHVNTEVWEYPQASGQYVVCASPIGRENPGCVNSQFPNCASDHSYMGMLDSGMTPLCSGTSGSTGLLSNQDLHRGASRAEK